MLWIIIIFDISAAREERPMKILVNDLVMILISEGWDFFSLFSFFLSFNMILYIYLNILSRVRYFHLWSKRPIVSL